MSEDFSAGSAISILDPRTGERKLVDLAYERSRRHPIAKPSTRNDVVATLTAFNFDLALAERIAENKPLSPSEGIAQFIDLEDGA